MYTPRAGNLLARCERPLKLEGVKFTNQGYCSVTWFEELDQFEGIETVRSILNPFASTEYLHDMYEKTQYWRVAYLGGITGTGEAVFDNVNDCELADEALGAI